MIPPQFFCDNLFSKNAIKLKFSDFNLCLLDIFWPNFMSCTPGVPKFWPFCWILLLILRRFVALMTSFSYYFTTFDRTFLSKRIYFREIQVNNFAKGHFYRFTSIFKDNYLANIEEQGKYIPITSFDDVTWLRHETY